MQENIIIIPARYNSKRLPGKPLKIIGNKSMIAHVIDAAKTCLNATVIVATEDNRIYEHVKNLGTECIMTSDQCISGTDRVYEAIQKLNIIPKKIINLQGDMPLISTNIINAIIDNFDVKKMQVITPILQLSWQQFEEIKLHKMTNPFSGTFCISSNNLGLWFSKNPIPAVREINVNNQLSPYYKHIGIYGYTYEALNKFVHTKPSKYEQLESLEQLRFIENGINISTVNVNNYIPQDQIDNLFMAVDTEQDLLLVEKYI